MIHITYTTEHHNTTINNVIYCEEIINDEIESEYSGHSNTFCIKNKSEFIYLLVSTTEDDCCCMSGSVERVEKVSDSLKQIVDSLIKKNNKSSVYETKYYDIRSYKLHNETSYVRMYEQTYTIDRCKLECDDADYVYIWLHNGEKHIPFPDETQEHFENKLSEYISKCEKSKQYNKVIKDACDKITIELNSQIRFEKQRKNELLRELNNVCNLDSLKYSYVWELQNAPTISEKILNSRIENAKTRKVQKSIEII